MNKDSKIAATVTGIVLMMVVVMLGIGQCSRKEDPERQATKNVRSQGSGEANRPIVVNSNVTMPEGLSEYLKTNTNNIIVVNNTFQMPGEVTEMLAGSRSGMVTNVFVLPDGLLYRDNPEAQQEAEIARKKAESDKRDAMSALFAINHINWVVTKIKTYNDPAVLEEEYQGLTADALDLRVIKDPELIALIRRILDTIVELRIDEKEREMLKDELDQGMSDALVEAVSGISVTGFNPLQMAVSAVTSAVTAGMNYRKIKRKLQAQFKKQEWSLDKAKMRYLNDLNKDILSSFWSIVQKYPDLPDKFRVAEQDIQMLVDHLKDEDAAKRHDFLVALKGRFSAFRPYWYHRAAAAYEVACGLEKTIDDKEKSSWKDTTTDDMEKLIQQHKDAWRDAKDSIDMYLGWQQECGNILRRDPTVVKAAILNASVLSHYSSLKDSDPEKLLMKPEEQYKEIIKLVEENSSPSDWQSRYVCAVLALQELKNPLLAEQVIAPAIAELDWQRRRRLVEWTEESRSKFDIGSTNDISSVLATGDALCECKAVFVRAGSDKDMKDMKNRVLEKMCEDQYASVREKMFCYGASRYKDVLKKLSPDIAKMRVVLRTSGEECQYSVYLPFSWVITRDPVMALCIGSQRLRPSGKCTLKEHPDVGECAGIDFEGFKLSASDEVDNSKKNVRFHSSFKLSVPIADNKSVIKHYMVVVFFRWNGSQWQPSEARFGEWKINEYDWVNGYDSLKF